MIFSYRWLQDYVDIQLSPEELQEELTFSGIEVEAVEYDFFGEYVNEVVIAEILTQEKHPYRDNLFVCRINDGISEKQVVCGAPNCRAGLKTAYIPVGAKLGDVQIGKASFKGIESEGMLCSEKDINLSSEHEGIIELPDDVEVGSKLKEYYDLYDIRYEVEITPNRPDLLGIIGISRDIGAILDVELKQPQVINLTPSPSSTEKTGKYLLENREETLCPRYIATVVKGVAIKDSPVWLKKRLKSAGIKPINIIVDITNYVMMEYGHPLHAFDYDLLDEQRIIVRRAKKGETIDALDNKQYRLNETDLVIADGTKPVAIAGIIGGTATSITGKTTNILLEAANFEYTGIRKSSHLHKIFTDSSHRFERNLTDVTVQTVSNRAAAMIMELCGGELTAQTESYPQPRKQHSVALRPARANKVLTTDLTPETMVNYLQRLGLEKIGDNEGSLEFLIPHFRKDLTREIDLIEEIIRLYGYNNVGSGSEEIRSPLTNKKRFKTKRLITDFLIYNGYYEVINSSFSDAGKLSHLELPESDCRTAYIEIDNPIGSDSGIMRTSLLPGILNNVHLNLSNGKQHIRLFELGTVYYHNQGYPVEKLFLSGMVCGNAADIHWKQKSSKADIFTIIGHIEPLLLKLDSRISLIPADTFSYLQKGQAVNVMLGDILLGQIGKLDPLTAKQFDIEQPIYLFDLDIEAILANSIDTEVIYENIVRYPSVERDISFIVDKIVSNRDLANTIANADRELINDVKPIDEFTGKDIPSGSRSLTYRLTIGSKDGTLTDNTIQSLTDNVFRMLSEKHNIQKR